MTGTGSTTLKIACVVADFIRWLDAFGDKALDQRTFFGSSSGDLAEASGYCQPKKGIVAIAPRILCEACVPWARRWVYRSSRFPLADAHYAVGFASLYDATQNGAFIGKATRFLERLEEMRCRDFKEHCWGYLPERATRNGLKRQIPLITTTAFAWEAFLKVYQLDPDEKWLTILESTARHAVSDVTDFPTSQKASSCSYSPSDDGAVINVAACRAFLLTSASKFFSNNAFWEKAERNLHFVLENQNADGSWYYTVDGTAQLVGHYHTCLVMKALAKIQALTGHQGCLESLSKSVNYYLANLFAADGLPRPFLKAPPLMIYERELSDCAECIDLCLLLRGRFPAFDKTLTTVLGGLLKNWIKPDGSFRSRRLYLGWDNIPMHGCGQSQIFRSLAHYLSEAARQSRSRRAIAAPVPMDSNESSDR
jgi:hypothetical protein